jgi:hypothetical protein
MTLQMILRAVGDLAFSIARNAVSLIVFWLALLPLLLTWDWIKRRLWPPREDPERRAQAEAWAALMAEAEEHTRERRPRDPHVLTLTEMPHAADTSTGAVTLRMS